MKRTRYYLRKDEKTIRAADLAANPDEYGGMGMHMLNAIHNNVITIPLTDNPNGGCESCVSIQVTSEEAANRIEKDNGVDILAKGYWLSILNTKPCFVGTDELVPMWGVSVGDSIEKFMGRA